MHKIHINNKIFMAKDGCVLSEVLMNNGERIEHPCGGRGVCQKCVVKVNGKEELSCKYIIKSDITVELPQESFFFSHMEECAEFTSNENLCLALDLGTTTLALALVSLNEKKVIKAITATNPQRLFGADVMSRIEYSTKNGVDKLKEAVVSQINSMIVEMQAPSVEKILVAGNVTMLHILFGERCNALGVAPYTPVFLNKKTADAKSLGIENVKIVECLPSIHTFVGADIVAGLNFVDIPSKGKYNLLVDLGTNAEIALFDNDTVLCTSAAAGPCFEGANISCGMSATSGAICSYTNGNIKTIDNKPPCGICGTGLVDIIAELIRIGKIDKTGYMENDFSLFYGVTLTQADVREYQLAKSAVYSGIASLIKEQNITFEDIENVYISGGFSCKLNIENAIETGLIPTELRNKYIAADNSSLMGTVKYLCQKNDLNRFIKNAQYIDLANNEKFLNLFMENMSF